MCKHILFNNFDKIQDIETLKDFAEKTHDNDGFGAIIRHKSGKIETLKSLHVASFYMSLMQKISVEQVETLVVHHRTSTNGAGIDYAHPFEFQGNWLTHNGVVTVPGKHETKTKNDSEALLHHLIKTNFETKTISGYFSCFILNESGTTILVDDTAPIYTDGRVYSSHDLGKWERVALQKIEVSRSGMAKISMPIEVTKTSYGLDKSYLSLGYSKNESYDFKWDSGYRYTNFDDFLYFLSVNEEYELLACHSSKELKRKIRQKAANFGIKLLKREVNELADYFLEEMRIA